MIERAMNETNVGVPGNHWSDQHISTLRRVLATACFTGCESTGCQTSASWQNKVRSDATRMQTEVHVKSWSPRVTREWSFVRLQRRPKTGSVQCQTLKLQIRLHPAFARRQFKQVYLPKSHSRDSTRNDTEYSIVDHLFLNPYFFLS